MGLDGILLNRLVQTMSAEVPMKINRITQPSDHEFLFQCFKGVKMNLLFSVHPNFARIQFTKEQNTTNLDQTHLLMLFRKHLDGGVITKIQQKGFDRIVEVFIEHRDEMGVIKEMRLILELMGKSCNLILVNDENMIIDAHRRVSSFESNARTIMGGSEYEFPTPFSKKSVHELESYDKDLSFREQFEGISPLLEREILNRLNSGDSIQSIKTELLNSENLYLYKDDFHSFELKTKGSPLKTLPLMDGLDVYYRDLQAQDRIKSHTGDLLKLIKRELKRSKQKLPKLYDDYAKAEDSDYLREYGDLIFAFLPDQSSGHEFADIKDFEGNDVRVPLDIRYSAKDNALRYFKRYQKAKTSLSYLIDQIEKTEQRIEYFETLKLQCEQASVEDAKEIHEELLSQGIINQKRSRKKQQARKRKANYIVIEYDETTTIYVGKNNLQNDTITFKVANKEDYWFHAANTAGAHVLLKTKNMDETQQRLCCQLAAYFSSGRYSSSVEIHYTKIKNVKRLSGGPLGMVTINSQKSMFIDPDETYLMTYLPQ